MGKKKDNNNRNAENGQFETEKLTTKSQPRTLQLKFYAEQAGYTPDPASKNSKKEQIRVLKAVLQRMKKVFPPDQFLVWGIVHDSDYKGDDFYLPSAEKPHVHIYIIPHKSQRWRIERYLKLLKVDLREQDKEMWTHAVDTINNRHEAALYATHESQKAIKEGKQRYPTINVITNDMDAYVALRDDGQKAQVRVSQADWEKIYKDAYEYGYGLGAWKSFYDTLPNIAREKKAKVGIAREYYERGIDKHIAENNGIIRTCIFIEGEANLGKTRATKYALTQIYGDSNLDVSGGGSGQFDDIDPSYKSIFFNDSKVPAECLRNLCDDIICKLYRRNSANPYCAAELLIVTSNLNFRDWAKSCGMKTYDEKLGEATQEYLALKGRFFVCQVKQNTYGISQLYTLSTPDRGDIEKLQKKAELFIKFRDYFNESVSEYRPSIGYIRPDDLNIEVVDEDTKYQYDMAVGETAELIEQAEQEDFEKWLKEQIDDDTEVFI